MTTIARFGTLAVRLALAGGLATGLVAGLAACSADDGEDSGGGHVGPADLPADLCAAVPSDLREKWRLVARAHDSTTARDSATASCTMAGSYLGKPLVLDLRLTALAGESHAAARKAMADGVTTACAAIRADPPAFIDTGQACRLRDPGEVTEVARSVPTYGVAQVSATFGGDNEAGVTAEVARLTGILSTTEPADLG